VPTTTTFQFLPATAAITIVSSGAAVSNNNNSAASAAQRNDPADANWKGAPLGRFRFSGTFAGTPTVPSAIQVYALRGNEDGSVYETGFGTTNTPPGVPVATIPLTADATQVRDSPDVPLPLGYHKYVVRIDGVGSQLNSTWSLTCLIAQEQGVAP
jgi:hypothetical protein